MRGPDELELVYNTVDRRGVSTAHQEHVRVLRQLDRLGRKRVWLACPDCDARVRALHVPYRRGATRFLCRVCHGLAYASQQEHKSALAAAWDRLLRERRWRGP